MPDDDAPTRTPFQRYGGHALLVAVALAVVALVVWLFVDSGEDDAPAPAAVEAPAATPEPTPAEPAATEPAAAEEPEPEEPTATEEPQPEEPATEDPAAAETGAAALGVVGLETGLIDDHRPEIGERAPDFALANARAPDRVVRLSDFFGTPIVLNWYASWCGPCKQEIPDFQRAYQALDGKVVFLGVNLQEDADQAAGLLDVLVAKYPAVLDTDGSIGAHYRIPGMPTTFFIDAEGVIRSFGAGLITEDVLVMELAGIGVEYEPE